VLHFKQTQRLNFLQIIYPLLLFFVLFTMVSFLNNPSMTEIRFKNLRFLITNSPSDDNMQTFIDTCLKHNVTALVRVSEKTYDAKPIEAAGIKVYVC